MLATRVAAIRATCGVISGRSTIMRRVSGSITRKLCSARAAPAPARYVSSNSIRGGRTRSYPWDANTSISVATPSASVRASGVKKSTKPAGSSAGLKGGSSVMLRAIALHGVPVMPAKGHFLRYMRLTGVVFSAICVAGQRFPPCADKSKHTAAHTICTQYNQILVF